MASLEKLQNTVDQLKGILPFKKILDKQLNVLERGRKGNYSFIATSNLKNVKSGPNKGRTKMDGLIIVMFGNKDRSKVQTAIVKESEKFLPTLDKMIQILEITD